MTKMVAMFLVKPGDDPEAIYKYWFETHVPNVMKTFKGLRKYTIDRALGAPEGETPTFFGMAQLWFDDLDSARNALKGWRAAPLDDFRLRVANVRTVFTEEKTIFTGKAKK